MPKLSHSQRFSMSGRRYWSNFHNDRVIFWSSILHFAFHRLEHPANEILSNLIVYLLKCTTICHHFLYMKTLAHYLDRESPACCSGRARHTSAAVPCTAAAQSSTCVVFSHGAAEREKEKERERVEDYFVRRQNFVSENANTSAARLLRDGYTAVSAAPQP